MVQCIIVFSEKWFNIRRFLSCQFKIVCKIQDPWNFTTGKNILKGIDLRLGHYGACNMAYQDMNQDIHYSIRYSLAICIGLGLLLWLQKKKHLWHHSKEGYIRKTVLLHCYTLWAEDGKTFDIGDITTFRILGLDRNLCVPIAMVHF